MYFTEKMCPKMQGFIAIRLLKILQDLQGHHKTSACKISFFKKEKKTTSQ